MAELTPMMRQYETVKEQNPDCLLFFRLGDFYEMFRDDAKIAAKELDLALTTRDRGKPQEERTPMCGVPYHSAEAYIARLIAKGYKVAICEQMEDPALAKGLVERDIVRIVTPGTVMDESMLDEGRNNYLCCIWFARTGGAVSFCDLSTGELWAADFPGKDAREHILNEVTRFMPSETVLSERAWKDQELTTFLSERVDCRRGRLAEHCFDPKEARAVCEKQFAADPLALDGRSDLTVSAVGALLTYLHETQKTDLSYIAHLNSYGPGQYMELDYAARRNLELTETFRGKEKRGSLLWAVDRTKTPMGRRLLRAWMERPLLSPAQIGRRLTAVEALVGESVRRAELTGILKEIPDLERLISRAVYGTASTRDLAALSAGLGRVPAVREQLTGLASPLLENLVGELGDLPELRSELDRALADDLPVSVREGGFIRTGYNADVDHYRDVLTNGRSMVAGVEAREKERTGIRTLKVGYNKVFGYYIEVSKSFRDQVPDTYIRKQTLVNGERYVTEELKEMESEILTAREKLQSLEYELFTRLRRAAAEQVDVIQRTAAALAQTDVLTCFASNAAEGRYCRPEVDLSDALEITDGRHPVVEKMMHESLFVPNDTHMDCGSHRTAIITGPNMAGKSTYMRQVALIVLLAQMGSFVPAKSAHIGVADRIFTRIGASDDLSGGRSTFMVEMTEVAEMLTHATARSLLLLDEIGRGTSTYDGMAIARAVLEYCADRKKLGARTLFATHYHELTVLEGEIDGVENYNVAAKKRGGEVVFLRKIVRGGADQSFGVEVARLAGVPDAVLDRAGTLLAELEASGHTAPRAPASPEESDDDQLALGDAAEARVCEELRRADLNTISPIEAMNLLFRLKQEL